MATPYYSIRFSDQIEKNYMAIYYKAFVPHIGTYLPDMDYNLIGKKAMDYGYTSIIERIGVMPDIEKIPPRTTTIQQWGYTLSNLGFEFVKLNQSTENNTTYKRAVIIDRDYNTLLILFEKHIL